MILIYEKIPLLHVYIRKVLRYFAKVSSLFAKASRLYAKASRLFAKVTRLCAKVSRSFANFFFSTKMSPIKALVQETPCYHVHRISCQSPSFVKTSLS